MNEWSVFSWCLMSLPLTFPWVFIVFFYLVKAIVLIPIMLLEAISGHKF